MRERGVLFAFTLRVGKQTATEELENDKCVEVLAYGIFLNTNNAVSKDCPT